MQNKYKKLNNLTGWIVFAIATTVYVITSEPTASFWDCGEYIATSYKLQVGHPPGAPLFQMLGRFFSLFAFGDVTLVAKMVNTMSAMASGFTIMFLFWTITALARKIIEIKGEIDDKNIVVILGSGLIGALAYTFSDSFWFSAVEGEVYATSSFFTAIVFWAILKWERISDEGNAYKWLILIFFLIGLSIGVHLLNLLAIPAITLIYYFKKYKNHSLKGVLIALFLSFLILLFIMSGIIPEIVNLFAHSEIIFVNGLGLPFNTGTLFFALLLIILIVTGIRATHLPTRGRIIAFIIPAVILAILILSASDSTGNFFVRLLVLSCLVFTVYLLRKNLPALNTILLAISFLLIGYSSFLMLVIRSNAETPINENSPKDAISLLSYLNREQYGNWPLIYGNYYNAPLNPEKPFLDGKPVYAKDKQSGKYIIIDKREKSIPNYDPAYCTIFPRMWSQQDSHIKEYKTWAGIKNDPDNKLKPTFTQNLRYMFSYQIGHMYMRYFMWNFAGRQNDLQGHGGLLDGNWISGIKWLDEIRLGPQSDLPESMANNWGRNKFYMIPLILGLIGFFFHLKNHSRDTLVVALLFFMTGIAIVLYLNQYPLQPRERDYSYAASFYAFSIWIGLSVLAITDFLSKKLNQKLSASLAIIICLTAPAIMASEGWNDHSRRNRYTALELAKNFLEPCEKNAILFTFGDNDTFPLWYAQEVEGIRTDVRVVNLSLLSMDWYIDQMKKKVYKSDPLPVTIPRKDYIGSKREIVWFYNNPIIVPKETYANVKDMLNFAFSDNPANKLKTQAGKVADYFPTSNFYIPVDKNKIINEKSIPEKLFNNITDTVKWTVKNYALTKGNLILLNILAENNWERPIYFSATPGTDEYIGLDEFMYLEGLIYRLLPVKTVKKDDETTNINTDVLYKNMIENFYCESLKNPKVYLDETNLRNTYTIRNAFLRLSTSLINEGKNDSVAIVIDRCMEILPGNKVPYDYFTLMLCDNYYYSKNFNKANDLADKLLKDCDEKLKYYFSFTGNKANLLKNEKNTNLAFIKHISDIAKEFKQQTIVDKANTILYLYLK